jgi:hypothetical protein
MRQPALAKAGPDVGRVVHVTPDRYLQSAAKRFVRERPGACLKCGSTFLRHEPAFVHCRYCGQMARVADAPLGEQQLFELRSGFRLAC